MITLGHTVGQPKKLIAAQTDTVANDNSLVSISPSVVRAVPEDGAYPPEMNPAVNPLVRLRVLLYGRYLHVLILSLFLGTCGAVTGWILSPPKYEIIGYIRIRPYLPKVLYQNDENGVLPSFETFVDLQESLLQSQRVIYRASQNPDWVAIRHGSTTPGVSNLKIDDLVVDHPKGSELITVTMTDRDLNVAMTAVKSILQAYLDISSETNDEGDAHRLQVLEDLRVSLANQAHSIDDRILAIANEYGTDDLSQRYDMKVAEADRLEDELQQINLNLSIARAKPNQEVNPDPLSSTNSALITRQDVAEVDPRMRDYLTQEDSISLRLVQLRQRFGENNDDVQTASRALSFMENRIGDLLTVYQQRGYTTTAPSAIGRDDRSRMSPEELSAQQANVRALYEKVQAESLEVGRKDLQLRSLKENKAAIKQRLDEASNRINQLNLEATSEARISILSYGEIPTTPPKSKRGPLTAVGALAGFICGIGIVALWGLIEQSVRSVLQVEQLEPTVRMLGVLPILPENWTDPDQKSIAAHCVHQIRTQLDTGDRSRGCVLAITSPAAGDGKTSLTLALGLSFAAAGSRTLLIDCDLVGRGLTERLNAVAWRGIDGLLARDGVLTESQLKEAQVLANLTGRKLSEVLIERGYATESEVRRALSAEGESSVGLLNALNGDSIAACVTQILAKDLSILPLGEAGAQHSSQISPKAFRRIVSEARGLFDVVIVDTGPILGSLEASIVVREVDEVVIAVARNGRVSLVKRSITLLDSLGIRLAGLVFNRATPKDVAFTYCGSSANSGSSRSNGEIRSRGEKASDESTHHLPRLGSLAAAVVNSSTNGAGKGTRDDSHN